MCFLNGDLGGNLTASVDFGVEEYYDKEENTTTYTNVPIETIIREGVHTYAKEPYYNIIINDLDDVSVELLEYKGDTPLYLLREEDTNEFVNFTDNSLTQVSFDNLNWFNLEDLETKGGIFDSRIELNVEINNPSLLYFGNGNKRYTVAKLEYGQTAGYRYTDLIYAGDLISTIGETFTSILDKIKTMLGEFEYFYNLDGQFVFQKKKTYTQSSWNNIIKVGDDEYADSAVYTSASSYKFEDANLITSFQNTPSLSNLKNDYSIWGERETVSGVKVPVHYRYAIDRKPSYYKAFDGNIYYTKEYKEDNATDWRELIYQMALDYYKYHEQDDYEIRLKQNNPDTCYKGVTGYEQYYTDLQGFWRQLYDPATDGWTEDVQKNPSSLNFWFDFMDANSEMGQYSISAIGDRTKVVNDNKVTSIYFRQVPNLIFTTKKEWSQYDQQDSGYAVMFMTGSLENMFKISSQGKSAQDKLDELLYSNTYCIESVTIQAIPIYYLQPNTRIFVRDDNTKINGEYIISKITIPLGHTGIMSITATKAPEGIRIS